MFNWSQYQAFKKISDLMDESKKKEGKRNGNESLISAS